MSNEKMKKNKLPQTKDNNQLQIAEFETSSKIKSFNGDLPHNTKKEGLGPNTKR